MATQFAPLLRTWRRRRRLSQLELALASGVSQRHLSFLESERAGPSRAMVLQLCETLEVPLRERNAWLTAAGFAPVFAARPLADPRMGQVLAAVRLMLSNHEPFPAVAIDRGWNVVLANDSFTWVCGLLGFNPDGLNLLRLFFGPDGIRPYVVNWEAVAPLLWTRAQREGCDLSAFTPPRGTDEAVAEPLLPVLPVVLSKEGVSISLFSVIATFGTAVDVTADELRIETFFPADDATAALFRQPR